MMGPAREEDGVGGELHCVGVDLADDGGVFDVKVGAFGGEIRSGIGYAATAGRVDNAGADACATSNDVGDWAADGADEGDGGAGCVACDAGFTGLDRSTAICKRKAGDESAVGEGEADGIAVEDDRAGEPETAEK